MDSSPELRATNLQVPLVTLAALLSVLPIMFTSSYSTQYGQLVLVSFSLEARAVLREAMPTSPPESTLSQVTWVHRGARRTLHPAGVELE